MTIAEDYIRIFEASDGGSSDPKKTLWQIVVDQVPGTTANEYIAQIAHLAISQKLKVRMTLVDGESTISQLRIETSRMSG